jgi:uncharacterized protein (TIGR03437 family)
VVNAATSRSTQLAPGTLATLYGSHLALTSRAVSPEDVGNGFLPNVLPGTGVRVYVGSAAAPLLYVSPNQINFLVPAGIGAGPAELRVTLESRGGPAVQLMLDEVSPALFMADPEFAIAQWQDGVVILYATGLGRTVPPTLSGQLAKAAALIEKLESFRVELAGTELSPDAILYAGAAPGFAGLYQINLRMPESIEPNPEIRISLSGMKSPAGVRLRTSR